jgi:hypothetical protein
MIKVLVDHHRSDKAQSFSNHVMRMPPAESDAAGGASVYRAQNSESQTSNSHRTESWQRSVPARDITRKMEAHDASFVSRDLYNKPFCLGDCPAADLRMRNGLGEAKRFLGLRTKYRVCKTQKRSQTVPLWFSRSKEARDAFNGQVSFTGREICEDTLRAGTSIDST